MELPEYIKEGGRQITLYNLSFYAGLLVVTYVVDLPGLITGQRAILDEHYRSKFLGNYVLIEFLIVGLYVLVALASLSAILGVDFVDINGASLCHRLTAVLVTTLLISGVACFVFRSLPKTDNNIFSQWFHGAGYAALVYDAVLVVVVYLLFDFLTSQTV
ncbi:MAG: hypothetical protein VXW72_01245 [Candidatus Thermoplasmatota archaeon]|nr:hypothetical protein [Candidatus Thermoplasmatota archaeon]